MNPHRVWTKRQLEKRLRALGLKPTDRRTATGRFWLSVKSRRHIQIPNDYEGMYPNAIREVIEAKLEELGLGTLH